MTRPQRVTLAAGLLLLVPITALAALLIGGGLEPAGTGIPEPGAPTRWGLPAARAVHDSAAALTVGLLVLAATVLPPQCHGPVRFRHPCGPAVVAAAVSGTVWTITGAVTLALSYSDAAGTEAAGVQGDAIFQFVIDLDLGRSLALSVVLAGIATTGAWLASKTSTVGLMALIAMAALLPLTVTGHGASNHEAAVNLLAIHLIGATVWVGGLAGLLALRRALDQQFAVIARRYSRLAGWSFMLVLVSGVAGALLRVDGLGAFASAYGALLAAKTGALLLLGLAGWTQRRRVLKALDRDPTSGQAFARLAGVELLLMAAAFGLAVALSRSSPFALAQVQSTAEALLGYSLPPPLSAQAWVSRWRLDVVWAPAAALFAGWYIAAVVRFRLSGTPWPWPRVAATLAGCAMLIWATSSAPAVYGRVLPSMHVLETTSVSLWVPTLLVLGAPMTLAMATTRARLDGSWGPREWLSAIARSRAAQITTVPLIAGAGYACYLIVFYLSPVLELSLSSISVHMLTTTFSLMIGLLLASSLSDQGGRHRVAVLVGLLMVHALLGLAFMLYWVSFAGNWYAMLQDLWGLPLANGQFHAGLALWVMSLPPLVLLGALAATDGRTQGVGSPHCPNRRDRLPRGRDRTNTERPGRRRPSADDQPFRRSGHQTSAR